MNLSKKQLLGIVVLLIVLTSTSVTLAILYMTKSVDITGGVSVEGAIEVYHEDGVTPMTSIDFPLFTGGTSATYFEYFFMNNTGNQPVYVYWNISSTNLPGTLSAMSTGYNYQEDVTTKYRFKIWRTIGGEWAPNDYITPGVTYLAVDEGMQMMFNNTYLGEPNTAETFVMTISFYAEDA
jgi:hypothetical protein